MLKAELFRTVNERRGKLLLPIMTREEFIAAISSLEARGFIATDGEHCHANGKYYQEVKGNEYTTGN